MPELGPGVLTGLVSPDAEIDPWLPDLEDCTGSWRGGSIVDDGRCVSTDLDAPLAWESEVCGVICNVGIGGPSLLLTDSACPSPPEPAGVSGGVCFEPIDVCRCDADIELCRESLEGTREVGREMGSKAKLLSRRCCR